MKDGIHGNETIDEVSAYRILRELGKKSKKN